MFSENLILEIAARPFNGNVATGLRVGSGPRREYIFGELRKYDLRPYEDEFGNVWVEAGRKGEFALFSSHMDVDPCMNGNGLDIVYDGARTSYNGVLDNAAGCYLNMLTALTYKNGKRASFVFTASEEEDPRTKDWALGARNVVKELGRRGIKPDFCTAIDVTYPRLLITEDELSEMSDEEYAVLSAEKMMDMTDRTHCYFDGTDNPATLAALRDVVRRLGSPDVNVRDFAGYDEADIYKAVARSFAVGPVIYGKMDAANQRMPKEHLETARDVIRFLAETRLPEI